MNIITPSDTPTAENTRQHWLINRNFAFLWSGQAISILGDFVFNTTLIVWVAVVLAKGQVWTPLAVSGILLASSLPTIVLGPLAGVFVDRWNKRQTMLWANFIQGVGIAFLLLQVSITNNRPIDIRWQLGMLYLIVFLLNSCEQFFRPAMLALIGQVVPKDQQTQAMGLGQASISLATLIGPVLAPPLLLAFGIQWALLINMLSFLISALTIFFIRSPKSTLEQASGERRNFLREFREGAHFLFHHALLRTMLVVSIISMLSVGALSALDIFFVTQNLHTPPTLYGVLDMAMGAGAILGALLTDRLSKHVGLTRILWGSILVLGVELLVYARLTSFIPGLIVAFLSGVPFAALAVVTGPLLLRATPQALLGRVSALFNPFSTVATLIGAALAGSLDSLLINHFHAQVFGLTFGPLDTIFTGAGLLLLTCSFYAMLSLRHTDNEANTSIQAEEQEISPAREEERA